MNDLAFLDLTQDISGHFMLLHVSTCQNMPSSGSESDAKKLDPVRDAKDEAGSNPG